MLKVATAVQHTFVICLQGDDVILLFLVKVCNAFYCKVVCLSCPRREDDLLWISSNQGSNLQVTWLSWCGSLRTAD